MRVRVMRFPLDGVALGSPPARGRFAGNRQRSGNGLRASAGSTWAVTQSGVVT
jgi:hypothetical protein